MTASEDDVGSFVCSLPDEKSFVRAWRLVIDHSFPRVAITENEDYLASFVELGEHRFVENLIRNQVDDNMRLIPISRSVYELAVLVLHAFDRVETPFSVIDFLSEDVSFVPPFLFDHKTTVASVTEKSLNTAVDRALSHKALAKVATNANLVLFCSLLHWHSRLPLSSIIDLDIELSSFQGSSEALTIFFSQNSASLAFIFLDDLSLAERGKSTDLAIKLNQWPRSSPFLPSFTESEEAELPSVLQSLLDDILILTDLIATSTSEKTDIANDKLHEMQLKCMKEGEEMYGRLCALFCPDVISIDFLPKRHSDLKRFLAHLDPVRRTDPFIASIRQPGFFSRHKELFWRALEAETSSISGLDEILLYRGSMDLTHESLVTNSTIFTSPEEYGLLLGCSTDYREIALSNPCNAHSMSLGCSLFAGMLYDPTASVWTYWASDQVQNGFVIRIPIDLHLLNRIRFDLLKSPSICLKEDFNSNYDAPDTVGSTSTSHWSDWFFIPPVPAILGLAGSGELWHARSKCALPTSKRNATFNFISGMLSCSYRRVPDFLLMLDLDPPLFSSLPICNIKHP